MLHTYNLPLLAEKCMALQGLVELTLGDICEDLILSFICCAVRDSGGEETEKNKQTLSHFTNTINPPDLNAFMMINEQ